MRQVGEGAARWKEMLKGTGTGLQSPTVNLSKQPKLSGPGAKVGLTDIKKSQHLFFLTSSSNMKTEQIALEKGK